MGDQGNDISEYLISSAWDISTATFNQSFSVSTKNTAPAGIFFKSDGRHYYNIRQIKDDKLFLGEKVVADQSEWSNWDFSTQTKIYDLPSLLSEA